MGLFGAYNLVRAIAAAHIFIGYILITAPQKLATQSTIVILGEALGLVRASPFGCYSPLGHCSPLLANSNNPGFPSMRTRSLRPSQVSSSCSLDSPTC